MYPLVVIFLAGFFPLNASVIKFSLPLVAIGLMTSLYHVLLYNEIIPQSLSPCLEGVSCFTVFINWFGFITIPLLSLTAFSILLGLLIILKIEFRRLKDEK